MKNQVPHSYTSISELHRALGLPKPLHPLVSLVDYGNITKAKEELPTALLLNFYKISYKKNLKGKIRYGQSYYDFDEGGLSFVAPNQLIFSGDSEQDHGGYTLLVHADFIRNFPLGKNIRGYGFFSYSVAEALYLSDKEKEIILSVFKNIELELQTAIDLFSQEVMVSHIELLLSYSKRFYARQFITRKAAGNDLLLQVEKALTDYFNSEASMENGLPTIQYLAEQVKASPRYVSDTLKTLTGQSAQQHIHAMLIEKAKEMLGATPLSVSEIAYKLGFEHPQSFNKLFKLKTNSSPLAFRSAFN